MEDIPNHPPNQFSQMTLKENVVNIFYLPTKTIVSISFPTPFN